MEMIYSLLIILGALFVMIQAGKFVVKSLGVVARYLRISEYVISFVLIAIATSLPELSVGINSAVIGIPEVSFGDIIGTNIVNFCLILGLVAIVGKEIELEDYSHFKSNRIFQFVAALAPLLLLLDGTLSRLDGAILIILFGWYLIRLLDIDDQILGRKVLRPHLRKYTDEKPTTQKKFYKHIFELVVATAAMLGSSWLLISSVKDISAALGISGAVIGVLLVAICTSLPDLIVGLRSVNTENDGMALGDIFGASTIKSTLTLGVVALISPFSLADQMIVWVGLAFIAVALLAIFYFLKSKHSLSRREGSVLFSLYILFVLSQVGTFLF
jgi:cation:H+ antiporter